MKIQHFLLSSILATEISFTLGTLSIHFVPALISGVCPLGRWWNPMNVNCATCFCMTGTLSRCFPIIGCNPSETNGVPGHTPPPAPRPPPIPTKSPQAPENQQKPSTPSHSDMPATTGGPPAASSPGATTASAASTTPGSASSSPASAASSGAPETTAASTTAAPAF